MSAFRTTCHRCVGTELSLLDVENMEELLHQISRLQQQVSALQQQLKPTSEEKRVCGAGSHSLKQEGLQDCDGALSMCDVGESEALSTSTPESVCEGEELQKCGSKEEEVETLQDGDENAAHTVLKDCRTAPTPNTCITEGDADNSGHDELDFSSVADWGKESTSYRKKSSICSKCGKTLSGPSSLRSHMRTHTGDRQFPCACGKQFSYSSSLIRHQRKRCSLSLDSPNLPEVRAVKKMLYQCFFCGKRFSTKAQVSIHERLHTGKKPYKCSQCLQAFVRPDRLREHQRVHTGEKPYECLHCGKRFALLGGLKRHSKTHTGEKPYKCTACRKCFIQSTKLKLHLRTHTGERPYRCAECSKTFARTEHLRAHQKIHSVGKWCRRAPRGGSVMSVAHATEHQTAQ